MKSYKVKVKGNKLLNSDKLINQFILLEDGEYNIFIEKADVGQAKYFYYRDKIADFLGGTSTKEKKQLHEEIKAALLTKVFADPDNLNTEDYESLTLSTKFLSDKGWHALNKAVEIWAAFKFDFIVTI